MTLRVFIRFIVAATLIGLVGAGMGMLGLRPAKAQTAAPATSGGTPGDASPVFRKPTAGETDWGAEEARGGESYTLRGGSLDSATRNLQPLVPDVESRAQARRRLEERDRAVEQVKAADAPVSEALVRATPWISVSAVDYALRLGLMDAFKRENVDGRAVDVKQFDLDGSGVACVAVRLHERTGDRIALMWIDGRGRWRVGPSVVGSDLRFQRMPAGIRPGYLGEGERAPQFAVIIEGELWGLRPRAAWMPVEGYYVGGRPRRPRQTEIALATLNEPPSARTSSEARTLWASFLKAPPTPETIFGQDVSLRQVDFVSADMRGRRLAALTKTDAPARANDAAATLDPASDRIVYLYIRNQAFCAEQGYACRFILFGPEAKGSPLLAQGVTATGLYLVQHDAKVTIYGFAADGGIFHAGEFSR